MRNSNLFWLQVLAGCIGLATTSPTALAQTTAPIKVSVEPVALEMNSSVGRVTVSYRVLNSPASREAMKTFLVDAPTGSLRVVEPDESWFGDTIYIDRTVASWTLLGSTVSAGAATPALTLEAPGVPGIVRYWAHPDEPLEPIESVDDVYGSEPPVSAETELAEDGDAGLTVGVVAPPEDRSPAGLASHLLGMLDRVCELGWISNDGVCNALAVKLREPTPNWRAFLNLLDAQRGKHVNDTAYFLLRGNAEFVEAQ